MSYEERATWVSTIVTVLVVRIYCSFVLNQMGSVPLAQIANALFLTMMIGGLVSSVVKIVIYRRGY